MDGVITYSYAMGTGEELRGSDFDSLELMENPSSLLRALSEPSKGLIVPRFIGIYQGYELIAHTRTPEEANAIEAERKYVNMMERAIDNAAGLSIFSKLGISDFVHPRLIHVGYNPDIWTPNLVRESVGDRLNRIAISSIQELPNFYRKDTRAILTILEKGQEIFEVEEDRNKVIKALRPDIREFGDQSKLYGLTRAEYAFLNIIQRVGQEHPNIITGPQLMVEFAELLEQVVVL